MWAHKKWFLVTKIDFLWQELVSFHNNQFFVSPSWPVNDTISGEILAKESRFPQSEIFFATLTVTMQYFIFFCQALAQFNYINLNIFSKSKLTSCTMQCVQSVICRSKLNMGSTYHQKFLQGDNTSSIKE